MEDHVDATDSQQKASASAPPPIPPAANPSPPAPPTEQTKEPEKISMSDKIMLIATGFIALGTLVSAGAICFQWYEMHTGGRDTSTIASASERNAKAAEGFATSAAGINTKLDTAVGKLNNQADAMKALARAAKAQSDILRRQFFSSQQVIESQRANIIVSAYSVDHPMTFQEHGMSFAFTLAFANNGAFAANDVRMRYRLYFSQFDKRIFSEPGERQRALCKAPMEPPLKNTPKLTIYPGRAAPEQINGGWRFTDQDVIPRPNFPQHPIGLVPIVVGCVDYLSGVMSKWHQTGFIFEIRRRDAEVIVPPGDIPPGTILVDGYIFDQGENY